MNHRRAIVLPGRLVGVIRAAEVPRPTPPPAEPDPPVAPPAEMPVVKAEPSAADLALLLTRMGERVRQMSQQHQLPLAEMQQVAIELAVAIASRLLQEQIAAGAFAVERTVQAAIERLQAKQAVTVHLHPDDLALLKCRLGDDFLTLPAEVPIQFQPAPLLDRGDCRAEAGDLSVWTNLRRELGELRDQLLEGLPSTVHAA